MSLPTVIPKTNLGGWAQAVNREIHSLKNAPAEIREMQGNPLALGMPVTWSKSGSFGIGDTAFTISGSTDMPSGSNASNFPQFWICEANVPDILYSNYILANPSTFDTASYIQYIRQAGVNYDPQYPEPSTVATLESPNGRYWRALTSPVSSTSGSSIARFKINDPCNQKRDFFSASMWNAALNDYDTSYFVIILKSYYNRPSYQNDTLFGASVAYSYADDNFRTATQGTGTQTEQILRPYQDDDFVEAAQLDKPETVTISGSVTASFSWVEILPHRNWAKVSAT
jgi:hypothetical protein